MAPNSADAPSGVLTKGDRHEQVDRANTSEAKKPFKAEWIWSYVIFIAGLHVGYLYGVYLIFTSAKIATTLFAMFLYPFAILGITAGVHRLWTHRCYKATWQLRLILTLCNTLAFHRSIPTWARIHRQHHKYSDTDADPHNSKRGLFFSHMGWVMMTIHPDVLEKEKEIDVSDVMRDPIARFQDKHYYLLTTLFCFVLPAAIPVYFWNESWLNGFLIPGLVRYLTTMHTIGLVNSFAHFYGNKPYDKNLYPTENKRVALITLGEGWHNYHHAFPWDYKASELSNYGFNLSNAFIDFFAMIGWAYDLKFVSAESLKRRIERTGDGSHEVWGWGDKNISKEDQDATVIIRKQS